MTTKSGIDEQPLPPGLTISPQKDDRGRRVFAWRCGDKGGYSASREDAINDASIVCDSQPAPTPLFNWQVADGDANHIEVVDSRGNKVCSLPKSHCGEMRAELIIRAVNSHAELLNAAKAALAFVPTDAICYSEGDHGARVHVWDLLNSAIEKAGAK